MPGTRLWPLHGRSGAGRWLCGERRRSRAGGRRRARRSEKGRGKKGSENSLATLRNFWGGELVEEKARGRRRNGDDSREGRQHDEEDDELSTRVVSDFTGDARMRRMVGFCGKDYFRDFQTRSLLVGSLYFCVELP